MLKVNGAEIFGNKVKFNTFYCHVKVEMKEEILMKL